MQAAASQVKLREKFSALLPALGNAQLAGAGQDGVFDLGVGPRVDLGVNPGAASGRGLLLEDSDANAIGPHLVRGLG